MPTPRRRPSPALIVSIIALVVACGGTATAAGVLITNSKQVKAGALQASDLSKAARKSLRGRRGATGATGATGAKGAAGQNGASGKDGLPGAPGERGPSDAFSIRRTTLNTGSCPQGGCTAGATIATMPLAAGSYVIVAGAEIAPASPATSTDYNAECHLSTPDGLFQRWLGAFRTGSSGSITADHSAVLHAAITLAAQTNITMECSTGAVNFVAANTHMEAIQVAKLTESVG